MGTWNLSLLYPRLFTYSRLFAQHSGIRVSSECASYHSSSALLERKNSEAKPGARKRRSVLTSSGFQHRPVGAGMWNDQPQCDDIPENTASKKVWRREVSGPRESRSAGEVRVSSELVKLSLEDFPKEREKVIKDLKEDRNCETLFGVSPCLLAITQGRRKAWKLFVKEGEASKRASVQQVWGEALRRRVQVQRVSKKDLDKMCSGRVHQGVCLQASPLGYLSEENTSNPHIDNNKIPLWLVLDEVQDPMNLGAIIRSAYFLGVDRIACSLHNSCPLTPVVSKASSGVMEIMGVYGYDNLADMLRVKGAQGWQVIGTVGTEAVDPQAPVLPCSEFHMTKPTLLLMGGEGTGLSPDLCQLCDALLTIPPRRQLAPGVESLNVSVATGILLHSLLSSQRGNHGRPAAASTPLIG